MHVVGHPLDTLQGVAQDLERLIPPCAFEPGAVLLQQVQGRFGGVQAVAQLVGEIAAEAAEQARPLPPVAESLLAEGGGGDRR